MTTVFGKIIRREIPADIIFENDRVMAFRDIRPVAPVHIIIIPKKEIPDLQSVSAEDLPLIGEMVAAAQQIARDLGLDEGYRLLTNNGPDSGQEVFHLHFHLIGGKPLGKIG